MPSPTTRPFVTPLSTSPRAFACIRAPPPQYPDYDEEEDEFEDVANVVVGEIAGEQKP